MQRTVMAHEVMEAQLSGNVGQVGGSRMAGCRGGVKMFAVTDGAC